MTGTRLGRNPFEAKKTKKPASLSEGEVLKAGKLAAKTSAKLGVSDAPKVGVGTAAGAGTGAGVGKKARPAAAAYRAKSATSRPAEAKAAPARESAREAPPRSSKEEARLFHDCMVSRTLSTVVATGYVLGLKAFMLLRERARQA